MEGFAFCYRFRVRYSEVDPQNVVFNARYLDYGDLGITEYWRAVDFRGEGSAGSMDFHVAHADVSYRKPITADELIDIWCRIERFGNSSMTVLMELHGAGTSGDDLRARITEVQVNVDLASHSPKPIPQAVKDRFTAFDARPTPVRRGEGI